jgi:hypothetical protein
MSASVLATSTRAPGAPRPVVAATAGLVVHTLVGPAPAAARAGRAGVGEAVLFAAWAALLAWRCGTVGTRPLLFLCTGWLTSTREEANMRSICPTFATTIAWCIEPLA